MKRIDLIKQKLDWAKQHIRNYERVSSAFLDDPYEIGTKDKPSIYQTAFYIIAERSRFPVELPLIVGDAIHNIRSTLDHLVWQLVLANGETPAEHVAFPICETFKQTRHEDTAKTIARKIKGVHPKAAEIINALQPYNAGDNTLWHIHKLDIMDKHQLALATATYPDSWGTRNPDVWVIKPDNFSLVWNVKVGDELWNFPTVTVAKHKNNIKFRFDIAFSDPTILAGKSVLLELNRMADFVERILLAFDPWLY